MTDMEAHWVSSALSLIAVPITSAQERCLTVNWYGLAVSLAYLSGEEVGILLFQMISTCHAVMAIRRGGGGSAPCYWTIDCWRVSSSLWPTDMVWLYRSPIPVGRRGVFYFLKWFLPTVVAPRGGGRGVSTLWLNHRLFGSFEFALTLWTFNH